MGQTWRSRTLIARTCSGSAFKAVPASYGPVGSTRRGCQGPLKDSVHHALMLWLSSLFLSQHKGTYTATSHILEMQTQHHVESLLSLWLESFFKVQCWAWQLDGFALDAVQWPCQWQGLAICSNDIVLVKAWTYPLATLASLPFRWPVPIEFGAWAIIEHVSDMV